MNPPSPAEPLRQVPSRWAKLGEIGLFALLWVAFMQPPRTLVPSLDASWQMMLGYAYDHGLQYGRDLIPTMGPAGFLILASPAVHHLAFRLGWMLLGNAVLALVFWRLGRALSGARRFGYFAFLLLVVAPYAESMQGLALLILGLVLLRPELRAQPLRSAGTAALIGVLALFKFTHLTLAAAVIAAAGIHGFYRGGLRRSLSIAGGFSAGLTGGWLLLGQPLAALPAFLSLSAEISGGYVDGMSIFEGPGLITLGLGCLVASGAYVWNYWRGETDRARAHATVVMLATAWFLNWKHGFVRADGHTLTLFITCLLPALAFPALAQETATTAKHRILALLVILGFAGIWTGYAPALTQALATFNLRVGDNLSLLAELRHPHTYAARARADFAQFAQDHRLPRITALVGANPVDVLGTEQSLAMLDDFHYTPRPVFQNYCTLTPRLAALNEAFYASAHAPRFVLQKYQTIDGRVPALDDARVLVQVFTHYALIAEENGWLLWEKITPPHPLEPLPLSQSTVEFGQTMTVPSVTTGGLWVQVEVRPTLLGRLRALLYKPPHLTLDLTDDTGVTSSYRLVRAMGADGFLLQPHFATQGAITEYFGGRPPAAVRALRVTIPVSDRKYFSPSIVVAFSRVPTLPRPTATAVSPANPTYRMFRLAPVRVTSPQPAGPFVLEGREVFFIHAPGEMEFAPDLANTRLRGAVGLAPGAYTGPGQTAGVEIMIEHLAPTGRRTVLWQRLLDPAHRPADRGFQPFSVALPGRGRLLLRNLPGPSNSVSYAWTLWSEVTFE